MLKALAIIFSTGFAASVGSLALYAIQPDAQPQSHTVLGSFAAANAGGNALALYLLNDIRRRVHRLESKEMDVNGG